jgi:hypothetical protein
MDQASIDHFTNITAVLRVCALRADGKYTHPSEIEFPHLIQEATQLQSSPNLVLQVLLNTNTEQSIGLYIEQYKEKLEDTNGHAGFSVLPFEVHDQHDPLEKIYKTLCSFLGKEFPEVQRLGPQQQQYALSIMAGTICALAVAWPPNMMSFSYLLSFTQAVRGVIEGETQEGDMS